MIAELVNRCSQLVENRDIIVIQDTTSFNLNSHYHRLKKDTGIGTIEDNYNLGFFLHSSLVIDAFSNTVLGVGDAQLWHRRYDNPQRSTILRKMPIEQKESYKWIRACEQVKSKFRQARSITFVEDRDGDIYEQFVKVTTPSTHLVIRVCKNRLLSDGEKLYQSLAQQKPIGAYEIEIDSNPRKKRKKRTVSLIIRFKEVCIKRPVDNYNKIMPSTVRMWAVEASEENYSGEDKICWRLLTSHPVTTFDEALNIVNIYKKRWLTEQLFRLLKKQGFQMEESQLESGWAIRKLCVMALSSIIRTMQLMQATEDEGASVAFSEEEQLCLEMLNNQQEGKTEKLKNPFRKRSLLWSKWIVARLGGWKGYQSQRIPGPVTLKRGLDVFNQIFIGWLTAKNFYRDVGTQ